MEIQMLSLLLQPLESQLSYLLLLSHLVLADVLHDVLVGHLLPNLL